MFIYGEFPPMQRQVDSAALRCCARPRWPAQCSSPSSSSYSSSTSPGRSCTAPSCEGFHSRSLLEPSVPGNLFPTEGPDQQGHVLPGCGQHCLLDCQLGLVWIRYCGGFESPADGSGPTVNLRLLGDHSHNVVDCRLRNCKRCMGE